MTRVTGQTLSAGGSSRDFRSCAHVMAWLAVEGAIASIGGGAVGRLGLAPRSLSAGERQQHETPMEGEALVFDVAGEKVFLHSDGACTTIWFEGAEDPRGAEILETELLRAYPGATKARDVAHESDSNLKLLTFEVRLPNGHLAVVDAIYPSGSLDGSRFMIRVTAMARQN